MKVREIILCVYEQTFLLSLKKSEDACAQKISLLHSENGKVLNECLMQAGLAFTTGGNVLQVTHKRYHLSRKYVLLTVELLNVGH